MKVALIYPSSDLLFVCSSSLMVFLSVSQMPSWLGFLLPRKESLAPASILNCLRSGSDLGEQIEIPDFSDKQINGSLFFVD